jgi:opacity protein-like surface antigen
MKTKLFFITGTIAMLFTFQTMNAQIKYGLHGALNLETQADMGQLWSNNEDPYQGFLFGGFIEYAAGEHFSLQTELNYQKKGKKFSTMTDAIESVTRREFNYLTIPVLAKANFHDRGQWDLSFFTGPYLGFLTSAYSNVKTGDITTPIDINDQAKKTDMGIILGVGTSYKLANGRAIIAEMRYQMGLSQIDENDTDLRNKGMGITLGYRF